jgi:hypothetical protein
MGRSYPSSRRLRRRCRLRNHVSVRPQREGAGTRSGPGPASSSRYVRIVAIATSCTAPSRAASNASFPRAAGLVTPAHPSRSVLLGRQWAENRLDAVSDDEFALLKGGVERDFGRFRKPLLYPLSYEGLQRVESIRRRSERVKRREVGPVWWRPALPCGGDSGREWAEAGRPLARERMATGRRRRAVPKPGRWESKKAKCCTSNLKSDRRLHPGSRERYRPSNALTMPSMTVSGSAMIPVSTRSTTANAANAKTPTAIAPTSSQR